MTAALAGTNFAIVAADTATNLYPAGGGDPIRLRRFDKVRKINGGVVTFVGDRIAGDIGFAALSRLESPDLLSISAALADVFRGTAEHVREAFPGSKPEETLFSIVLASGDGFQLATFAADGGIRTVSGPGGFVMTCPPEIREEAQAIHGRVVAEIWEAKSLEGRLAVLSRAFRANAARAPSMSDDMHVMILARVDGELVAREVRSRVEPRAEEPTLPPADRLHCDVGTLTAGTIGAGIIVASQSFTAMLATFNGVLIQNELEVQDRARFVGTGAITAEDGRILEFYDTSNPNVFQGDIRGVDSGGITGAPSGGLWIRANTLSLMTNDADEIGFHGVTPVAQQTVTGSRGGNAALASLLTALDAVGLIVDSSS